MLGEVESSNPPQSERQRKPPTVVGRKRASGIQALRAEARRLLSSVLYAAHAVHAALRPSRARLLLLLSMKGVRHEARLALAAVIVAAIAGGNGNQAYAFVGPSVVAPGCSAIANTPPPSSSYCAANKKSGGVLFKAPPATSTQQDKEHGTVMPEETSLSRRMQARRARSKPRVRTSRSTAAGSQLQQSTEESEKRDDVGNLFR